MSFLSIFFNKKAQPDGCAKTKDAQPRSGRCINPGAFKRKDGVGRTRNGRVVVNGLDLPNGLYEAIRRVASREGVSEYFVIRRILAKVFANDIVRDIQKTCRP